MSDSAQHEVKWGIIGPGRIAAKFATDLALIPDARLTAVASRDLDRARAFAVTFGADQTFDHVDDLLDNGEVDIVYVATPHTSHLANTVKCLTAGVAVLCEKPAGMNRDEVKQMVDLSQARGTFFMEALWTRFLPSMQKVLEIVASGEMGEVENVEAEFCFSAPVDAASRLYDLSLGGGSILDIGIYPVFLSYLLLGMPREIKASGQLHATGADQTCSIEFRYDRRRSAALHSSIIYASDMPARITMTRGYILMQPRWHESPALTILQAGHDVHHIACPPLGKGYTHEVLECHRCLRQGLTESPRWSHADSLNLISLLDQIRRQVGVTYPQIDPQGFLPDAHPDPNPGPIAGDD